MMASLSHGRFVGRRQSCKAYQTPGAPQFQEGGRAEPELPAGRATVKFELVVKLSLLMQLGVLPPVLQAGADEVIE
jgi:hypothetical protein